MTFQNNRSTKDEIWSMKKCNKTKLKNCEICADKTGCYTYITLKDVLS